jgi:hypothetical protein
MNHVSFFRRSFLICCPWVKYKDEDLALLLFVSLPSSSINFRDTIILSRDTLILPKVYEPLHQRDRKTMVQAEGSSSKAETLQVYGRP